MDDEYFKEDTVESVKEELQEQLLENAYSEIASLRHINKVLRDEQLELRDEIALHCYVSIFEKSGDPKQSAMDAYRMADAFLRVKETGGVADDKPNNE